MEFRGVIPPTLTAFGADGSLSVEGTRWHINYVIEAGVHGVFPCGTMGEGPLLSFEEKLEVIATAVQAARKRVPVLAGVGCPSTWETVRLAREAERIGADAVIVVTPYYYPPSDEGLLAHYRAVAEAVHVPVLVYHIPSRTGYQIPLGLIPRLASVPGVVGLKDSSGDAKWLRAAMALASCWRFFVGSDSLLCEGFAFGVHGAVSGVANVLPDLVVRLYDAAQTGAWQQAKDLQAKVSAVRDAMRIGPYLAGPKAVLRLLGHDLGTPRLPLVSLTEPQTAELHQRFVELGFIS